MEITELLQASGIDYAEVGSDHHVRHGWIGLECPYCEYGTGKRHLGINLSGLYANCWKCGRLPIADALGEILGVPPAEARRLLRNVAPDTIERPVRLQGRYRAPIGVGPLLPAHREYLAARGFDPDELVRLWQIGGIGPGGGQLSWRVFIPVHFDGRPVYWTCRAVKPDAALRYIAAEPQDSALPRNRLLYGWDFVRGRAVVVEGPTDAWAIGPGAVALMGLVVSAPQLQLLAGLQSVTICLDAEAAAQERAEVLAGHIRRLSRSVVKIVRLAAKDAASADPADRQLIRDRYL